MAERIALDGVRKSYPGQAAPALRDLTLSVEPGTFLVLLGPSGSGKTTLLRCLAGIERVSAGRISIGGVTVADGAVHVPPEKRELSMVFQDYALWPHLTAAQNVAFALRRRRVGRAGERQRAEAMLRRVGLAALADRYPNQLSGGEQQRVALARALVAGTGLILCDEPLSNLDADLRERLRVEIAELVRDSGATTVYITHDQAEAFALADRVGVLEHGALVQLGSPEEIYTRPASPFVARFTGLSGELTVATAPAPVPGLVDIEPGGPAWTAPLRVPATAEVPGGGAALLMIRPTGVALCYDPGGEQHLSGTVADVAFRGRGYEHAVDIPGHGRLAGVLGPLRAPRGSRVGVRLEAAGCHLFPVPGGAAPQADAGARPGPRRGSTDRRDRCAGAGTRLITVTTAVQTTQVNARDAQAEALIIGVTEGSTGPGLAAGAQDADAALGGGLAATLAVLGATGVQDEVTRIASGGALAAPLIVAVGLGPDPDPEALRRGAGAAVRSLAGKAGRIAIALPAGDAAQAEAVTLGALLGRYAFTRYRASEQAAPPELTLIAPDDGAVAGAVRRGQVLADAVTLVRDLVNTSPADLYPESFAAAAEQVARASGLDIEVLDEKALADGGYGGLTGVGQGSARPPRLVRVSYAAPGATRTVAFAGKGITFDSGGLSLKPPKAMETMKSDMGGAAAVLGALQAVAALQPQVNVVGYLAIAENMPGGRAQRPSDVITIYGGKTVEVLNTDAEGRLVLADALARSAADGPDLVVDVATLTGAQLVALGTRISGVMASDAATADGVVDAARRAGEQAWAMPLPEELRKGLDSTVADIANVSGDRNGGMLVAGLFLREFAPDGVRWAHVDIAGPAYNDGEPFGYTPKGGTGAAVRMLVQIALDAAAGQL